MAKKSIPVPALSPARKPSPSPAAVDALCVLLSTYIDLNVPTPQELFDLLPEDAFTAGSAQPAGKVVAPRRLIPACFSPRYSDGLHAQARSRGVARRRRGVGGDLPARTS